jgi:precorrin-6A/cobalt-precorrin-6A reductase
MRPKKILVLGGTRDARTICDALHAAGHDVTLSLAGVTKSPEPVSCPMRTGGFGGAAGLQDYILSEKIEILIDGTHPFAAQISANASIAAKQAGITHLRLNRPPWSKRPGAIWHRVKTFEEAANDLPTGARVFLTIGRSEIDPFMKRADFSGVLRMIEPPAMAMPPNWQLILARPPTSTEPEIELMRQHSITHLVCKNAGGPTSHKLIAAWMLNIPTVMIDRPVKRGGRVFENVQELIEAAEALNTTLSRLSQR